MQALRILQREVPELLARRPRRASPRVLEAASAALQWLREGVEEAGQIADAWFADNMDLDISREERRRRLAAALAAAGLGAGDLAGLRVEDAGVLSRNQLRWELPGRGDGAPTLRIELLLDPRREALLQSIDTVTVARG